MHLYDFRRSIPLKMLQPLLQQKKQFISLQKEIRESDQADLKAMHCYTEMLQDFTDTAALISAMDLVITVDTSVAHLAGALGKPVWILLSHVPDYRWLLHRTDSPLYPTARLFRQSVSGVWDDVIEAVNQALILWK